MNASKQQSRPMRRQEVWLRQVGNENALFNQATGAVHLLNDTALALWHLCDGQTTQEEMVAAICEVSGLHAEVVTEDVGRTIGEFASADLVTWVD
jgi:PqqD family protein of HPr-rel-A system